MDIALLGKCLLGALAVLLIQWLSGSRYFFVAGLVPLFPTFALIAQSVRLPLASTLLLATLCWLLAAGVLLWGWQHWHA